MFEIAVLQPGQFRDARREPALRSDQRLELFEHAFVGSQHRSDLDDLVLRQMGPVGVCLQVEDHILR